ncbi:MAG: rRNA pseudouridine synthase [Halobacteriovoraceae bacterium]|nr:rRNA pseudouridine synthase [Halobacteriovoraceae bacterium]
MADCGVTSRRKAEELIAEGKVVVNGKKVKEQGVKVDPQEDVVEVSGKTIDILTVDHIYLVMNKPRSYISTVSDPEGRKTVMDLIPIKTRVYPIGRLDYLSEGLLLFTNDGDFANKVMHPKFQITKTYEVKVFGKVNDTLLRKLRTGVEEGGDFLKPMSVRVIQQLPNKTWLEFRLTEGKNREIRRICEGCGITIDKLKRVAIGNLSISGLQPGRWNYVTKSDLFKQIGITKDGSKRSDYEEYVSLKKSLDVKRSSKRQKDATPADSKEFNRYRKDEYYETLKLQKEAKTLRDQERAEQEKNGIKVKPSYQKTKANPTYKR